MLKKISMSVIAALVLLYPLATWLIGFFIERRFDDVLVQVRERAPYATVVEHQFRRGWYTSQAETTLEFLRDVPAATPGAAATAAAPLRMTVRNVIHHGPICGADCVGLARVDTRIVFSDPVQSAIAKIFGPLDPLNMRSRLGFFGGGSTLFSSPPANDAKLDDGAIVNWGGLQATVNYGAGVDSYTFHANAPRAMYSASNGMRFQASDALFDSQAKRALRSLYAGDSSFSLAHMAFAGADGAGPLSIDDLRFTSLVSADHGFLTLSMNMSSGSVAKMPVALTGAHFDVTFRHLEMESLEQLVSASRELNQDRTLTPAARSEKLLSLLKQQSARLLARQPQIAFDRVSVANAGGAAVLKGLLQLPGVTSADFADDASPKGMIQKLDADLDLTVDEALLKSLPGGADGAMQLQRLASQGLATQENGRFHTRILFRRGQLTFNGKPFRPGGP
jgi:uncharacterized protein YdgA (DUF945 family)